MPKGILVNKVHLSSLATYRKHYRDKENPPVKKGLTVKDYNEYVALMANIGRAISYGLTETHGGVRIRGLGYFSVIMKPFKSENLDVYTGGRFMNTHADFMIYRATFVPERVNHPIKDYVMENTAFYSIKQRLKDQIKTNNFKYRTYLHTFMKTKVRKNTLRW